MEATTSRSQATAAIPEVKRPSISSQRYTQIITNMQPKRID